MNDLALADELRGELRRSAALAGRAAQYERVAAVLDDRVRDRRPLGARHLTDRLEPENAASAGLTQPRQGVLEAPPRPPEWRAAPCFTHPRMEKGVPSWRVVYSSTRMAELAVERTEPNMRSLPSSRNGPAAGPASRARGD